MINHFSKYIWARCISDKISHTGIKNLKKLPSTYNKLDILLSDKSKNSQVKNFKVSCKKIIL